MKIVKSISLAIIGIVLSYNSFAQLPTSWDFEVTDTTATVKVPNSVDLTAISTNSFYIGAFYSDSVGTPKCAGVGQYQSGSDFSFNIYGTENAGGLQAGTELSFLVYDISLDCQFEVMPIFDNGSNRYQPYDTLKVDSIKIFPLYSVVYDEFSVCQSDSLQLPVISSSNAFQKIFNPMFSYTASTGALSIDPASGVINPYGSDAGSYLIEVTSDFCLAIDQISFQIREYPGELEIFEHIALCDGDIVTIYDQANGFMLEPIGSTADFVITDAGTYTYQRKYINTGCYGKKTIEAVQNGLTPDSIEVHIESKDCLHDAVLITEVRNSLGTNISSLILDSDSIAGDRFEGIDVGDHFLSVIDSDGCRHEFLDPIVVDFDNSLCDKEDIVFYPDDTRSSNGNIYFEEHESIKILNESGTVVRELQAPVSWDGTDRGGSMLPSGLYFIIFEDGTLQYLTIVR